MSQQDSGQKPIHFTLQILNCNINEVWLLFGQFCPPTSLSLVVIDLSGERGVMWWPEPALYYCWLVIGRSIDMNEDWSRQKATVSSEISPDSDFVFTVLSMRVRYPLLRLCQLLWQLARTGHNDALHTHHTPQRALRATIPHTTGHSTQHTAHRALGEGCGTFMLVSTLFKDAQSS